MAEETKTATPEAPSAEGQRPEGQRPEGQRSDGPRPEGQREGRFGPRGPRPGGGREGGRKYFRRKKVCKFCVDILVVDRLDLLHAELADFLWPQVFPSK